MTGPWSRESHWEIMLKCVHSRDLLLASRLNCSFKNGRTVNYPGLPRWPNGEESACQCRSCRRYRFHPLVWKIPWRRKWQPTSYSCLGNPMDKGAWWATVLRASKSWTRMSNWAQWIPRCSRRRRLVCCSPWGRGELDMTQWLHFHFSLSCMEQEMTTQSSVLAWRIPGMGEPGGLPSLGSHRVGHDWSNLAAAAADRRWEWKE